ASPPVGVPQGQLDRPPQLVGLAGAAAELGGLAALDPGEEFPGGRAGQPERPPDEEVPQLGQGGALADVHFVYLIMRSRVPIILLMPSAFPTMNAVSIACRRHSSS